MVSLRGPSGNKWPVELAKISGELLFARGWKEFLCDHRIVYGYLLVFRYDGKSQFSVTVFLPTSCEAPYAFLAEPRHMGATAVAAEDENGHTGTNADGTAPQEEDSHIGTAADGTPQNEEEEDASEEYEGSMLTALVHKRKKKTHYPRIRRMRKTVNGAAHHRSNRRRIKTRSTMVLWSGRGLGSGRLMIS